MCIRDSYCINVHASLLPKYRGAAPINWAIIRGEKTTGITIMKMNEAMDEGDIMLQKEIPIEDEDDAKTLHDKLALVGERMIGEAVSKIKSGNARFKPQTGEDATYAPMLKKEDGLINWDREASAVVDFVRGMNPWPGAYTYLDDKLIKIFKVRMPRHPQSPDDTDLESGQIIGVYKDSISVKTKGGAVLIAELQQESKKRMPAREFVKGSIVKEGALFKPDRGGPKNIEPKS